MQRSAVASDVERGPSDERAQLCEIELSAFDNCRALVRGKQGARIPCDRGRRLRIGRTGREDDTALRIA